MTDVAEPQMPQPTAEHKRLEEHVGTWNVDCTFFMGPDQPPMNVQGTEKIEMFGDFWTTSVFESEMFGAPFKGRAALGYDPVKGQYVSTWYDTMTPHMYAFTGGFDASGKTLEMSGEGVDCNTGQMTTYRTREEHTGKDSRTFEMFMNMPGGEEIKLFTHKYTRA